MAIEVPQLTLETLSNIKQRIIANKAIAKDFSDLDQFLSVLNSGGYILKTMKDKGFNTYQDYVNEISKPEDKRDVFSVSFVRGAAQALIISLEKYLNQ